MSISKTEVKHIAKLARIELSAEEIEKFRKDLSTILEYIEKLKSVNTEGVEPLASVTGLENALREDRSESPSMADEILANAPERVGRFIKVKKVFENY